MDDRAEAVSNHPTPWAACVETQSSAVFMAGERVLKLKKPIRTAFLDYTSLEAREAACESEVRLNTRLSPDVYLGVVHVGLHDGGPGEPVVVMRRLQERDQLRVRMAQGDSHLRAEIREVARRIAVFHSECDIYCGPDSAGSWEAVHDRWIEECDEIDLLGDVMSDAEDRWALRLLGTRYLAGRKPLFDARLHDGQVREGHGDLRSEHVYLTQDGPRIIDCVEFDPQLRIADVLSDVAFLAMDLEQRSRDDLAEALLSDYREFSATQYPASLLEFYVAYRALVRAKVHAIRARQVGATDPESIRLVRMAVAHLRRAMPTMICVGGLPGSGKSTVSEALAVSRDAVHLSTDEVRHGLAATAGAERDGVTWETGIYAPEVTDRVYRELFDRAEAALREGYSVVLDASWRDARHRSQAHAVAGACWGVPVDIRCEVDQRVALQRLTGSRQGFSQAGVDVREEMGNAFAEWPAARVLNTNRDLETTLRELGDLVDAEVAVVTAGRGSPPQGVRSPVLHGRR